MVSRETAADCDFAKCLAVAKVARAWAKEVPKGIGRSFVITSRESLSPLFAGWLAAEE